MVDYLKSIMDSLNTDIFGIPFIFWLLAFGGIAFFIYYYMLPKQQKKAEFKRISMFKAVKEHYEILFNTFSVYVNLPYILHMNKKGLVKNYMLLHWNRNLSYINNLKANKNINENPEIQKHIDNNDTDTQKMYVLKIVNNGLWNKTMYFFGWNYPKSWTYHLINESDISIKHNQITLNPYLEPQAYYDTFIYSEVAKDYIDNISFRKNREFELEEMSNIVKKQTYLELEQAKKTEQLSILDESIKQSQQDKVEQIRKAKI